MNLLLKTGIGSTLATLAVAALSASANAANFITTLTLNNSIGTPPINTVIFNWSTNLTTGTVTESGLTNWSYELLNGGSSVYTETVVSGGVVQPIGGVNRSIIDFNFNLDTSTLGLFDNDLSAVQISAATGTTYDIFTPLPNFFDFKRYENGTEVDVQLGLTYTQSTIEVTASTPEPGTIFGLLAVGALGAASRKRKG